jgi:hypothetical protein
LSFQGNNFFLCFEPLRAKCWVCTLSIISSMHFVSTLWKSFFTNP